jgi:hypothetical protein
MSKLPPAVREPEFRAVDDTNPERIREYFEPFKRELHSFLNQTSCLQDIQEKRGRWKNVTEQRAFVDKSFKVVRRHWYTYNWGGRSEAQFNIGLFPEYMRVGLGFEFTDKRFAREGQASREYWHFRRAINRRRRAFEKFVEVNQIRIEWNPVGQTKPRHTQTTEDTLKWLNRRHPPKVPDWVFVGRLLNRTEDAGILADPYKLKDVLESVLGGFLQYWEETQAEANGAVF